MFARRAESTVVRRPTCEFVPAWPAFAGADRITCRPAWPRKIPVRFRRRVPPTRVWPGESAALAQRDEPEARRLRAPPRDAISASARRSPWFAKTRPAADSPRQPRAPREPATAGDHPPAVEL